MDNTRKVVFVVFAIYLVLGLQFFFETGSFIVPVVFNPIVLLLVSVSAVFTSYKKVAFELNVIYLTGVLVYAVLSERTLNIIFNYFKFKWIPILIDNPFTRLIEICTFLIVLVGITAFYALKNNKGYILLVLLIFSAIAGVLNQQLYYVSGFTIYVIVFILINYLNKENNLKIQFSGIIYQLILFIFLENMFIFLH